MTVRRLGLRAVVIDSPLIHNSLIANLARLDVHNIVGRALGRRRSVVNRSGEARFMNADGGAPRTVFAELHARVRIPHEHRRANYNADYRTKELCG